MPKSRTKSTQATTKAAAVVFHVAASLQQLLAEVNQRWPNRDKESDGALGDAAHASRESDHNPDYDVPPPRYGVVRARDIDRDGIDVEQLLEQLRRECVRPNPRVAYVIYDRQIMRSYYKRIGDRTYRPGEWAPYDGPNPHTGHVHVSVNHTAAAEDDVTPWFITEPEEDMTPQQADRIIALLEELTSQGRTQAVRMSDLVNRQFPAARADLDREADVVAGPDAGDQP